MSHTTKNVITINLYIYAFFTKVNIWQILLFDGGAFHIESPVTPIAPVQSLTICVCYNIILHTWDK